MKRFLLALLGLTGLVGLAALAVVRFGISGTPSRLSVEVYASGLLNPRGLTFGPDGALYVAEAGTGGKTRVPVDTGRRYNIGDSGRISRIPSAGMRTDYVTKIPSSFTSHDDDVGPASLALLDNRLYLVTAAGGTEVGDPRFNNGIFEVRPDALEKLLDLNELNALNPSQARINDPVKADVPGGMPWGLTAMDGRLYMTDANHEFILEVAPDGQARRIYEYPRSNRVVTGISAGPDGWLYVAELGPYPYLEGSGDVFRIKPSGEMEMVAQGLTTSIAALMQQDGSLLALEFSAPLRQVPHSGRIIRIAPSGERTIVYENLHFPTAMIVGPDGALYVSNAGHLSNRGEGEVLRIRL